VTDALHPAEIIEPCLPTVSRTVPTGPQWAGLRGRLERLGRAYVAMPRMDPSQLKLFVAKEKQAIEFRQRVVEAGQLPPNLQRRAAKVVREIEQHYQSCANRFAEEFGLPYESIEAGTKYYRLHYAIPRTQNAKLSALDCYFDSLLLEWMRIGGDWPEGSNTKAIRNFIIACAAPAAGPKSTSERAVRERLYRLDTRRRERRNDDFTYAVERRWHRLLSANEI
jgi:hypothetical protein